MKQFEIAFEALGDEAEQEKNYKELLQLILKLSFDEVNKNEQGDNIS